MFKKQNDSIDTNKHKNALRAVLGVTDDALSVGREGPQVLQQLRGEAAKVKLVVELRVASRELWQQLITVKSTVGRVGTRVRHTYSNQHYDTTVRWSTPISDSIHYRTKHLTKTHTARPIITCFLRVFCTRSECSINRSTETRYEKMLTHDRPLQCLLTVDLALHTAEDLDDQNNDRVAQPR